MIVKFLPHKGKGTCKATMDYLLGKDRDREQAKILQGDPEITRQLADSLEFKHKYTVGVLSFEEKDLEDKTKKEIMADFEKSLLCGLAHDQYDITWIEHKDKDRLELNFVIPKVELNTGKAMNPYYDPIDRKRVNAFKDHTNAKYDLHDPNDPANRQPYTPNMRLPKEKKELQEAITGFLIQKIGEGSVIDREGVLRALESDLGLSVARITPNAISIKDPTNENGRNIRLKGEIYADTFRFSQEHSTENERASQNYRANRIERIRATGAELTAEIERKRAFNIQRYSEPRKELERANQQDTSLQNSDRGHNGLATSDNTRARDIQSIPSQEYHQETGGTSRDTAEHRPVTNTGKGVSQGDSNGMEVRKRGSSNYTQDQKSNLEQRQQRQSITIHQIGLLDHAKRLHERLQQFAQRVRATVSRIGGDKQQSITTNRAIDGSQSQFDRTERAIEQRERETSQHQQTAERFTYQAVREIENEINPDQDREIEH